MPMCARRSRRIRSCPLWSWNRERERGCTMPATARPAEVPGGPVAGGARCAPRFPRWRHWLLLIGLCPCAAWGCGEKAHENQPGGTAMSIELSSPAFSEGGTIPKQHTGDGADTSPPLRWAEPPAGTHSFALVCDDPDAPRGTWVHWVIFDLPTEVRALEEAV